MAAQEFIEGSFGRAVVALQQVAVGRLVKLLGALFRLAGGRRCSTHWWEGACTCLRRGRQDAIDFIFGGAWRNGHRTELRALGLWWPRLDLRPAETRRSWVGRDRGSRPRQL